MQIDTVVGGRLADVAAVLGVLARNAHSVCDDEPREVGVALFGRAVTAANHSCAPNVWPRFVLDGVSTRGI